MKNSLFLRRSLWILLLLFSSISVMAQNNVLDTTNTYGRFYVDSLTDLGPTKLYWENLGIPITNFVTCNASTDTTYTIDIVISVTRPGSGDTYRYSRSNFFSNTFNKSDSLALDPDDFQFITGPFGSFNPSRPNWQDPDVSVEIEIDAHRGRSFFGGTNCSNTESWTLSYTKLPLQAPVNFQASDSTRLTEIRLSWEKGLLIPQTVFNIGYGRVVAPQARGLYWRN